ncbi:MAG: R3H domain-containing nucleic acid-binding protein, partial [Acidobacteriaceae bacterium]|nr:R3H domain-containing nucleic acid-binding protein [Acidobacteriaceae bacterium]
EPYRFAPMSSRERRILHLVLKQFDDLKTESSGEGPRRCVVLYPGDYNIPREDRGYGDRNGNRGGGRGRGGFGGNRGGGGRGGNNRGGGGGNRGGYGGNRGGNR